MPGENVNFLENFLKSTVTLQSRLACLGVRTCLRVFVGLLTFQAFEIEVIKRGHHESGDFSCAVLSSAVWAFFTFKKPLGHAPRAF